MNGWSRVRQASWLERNDAVGSGVIAVFCLCWVPGCAGEGVQGSHAAPPNFQQTKVFLVVRDFRPGIEAGWADVIERPSASRDVALTYVDHALDAYLDSLAKADRWVAVELLAQSLSAGGPEGRRSCWTFRIFSRGLLIQSSARKQVDVSAALATRLDEQAVAVSWGQ